jgi:hypothetical protein
MNVTLNEVKRLEPAKVEMLYYSPHDFGVLASQNNYDI